MSEQERRLGPTTADFVVGASVPAEAVTVLEGAATDGLSIKPLMVGKDALFMEVHRRKGLIDPQHAHPDHESLCYLIRGRLRVIIDGKEFLAGPGDIWKHRTGVVHYHEALEDCVQIEIKTPPFRTWR